MTDEPEPETTGWDAIDSALERVYPDVEARDCEIAADDPLYGIRVYPSDLSEPHWHFVTFGFSELWSKESDDPAVSGFGFELTFRLARARSRPNGPSSDEPPEWVEPFLQNLARYVFRTGNVFGRGDSMPLNGPIAPKVQTSIRAVGFLPDPSLPPMQTPNGRIEFLQVVGLADDELAATHRWDMLQFLKLLQSDAPVLVSRLERKSSLTDAKFAGLVEERTRSEGSSSDATYCDQVRFNVNRQECTLTLGAAVVPDVLLRLEGRTLFGRPFDVCAPKCRLRFAPGPILRWERERGGVVVHLSADHARTLLNVLKPVAGEYVSAQLRGLTFVVEKSAITDPRGRIVEEIG